ncbi:MAG TPA: methyltransferase domain-containing protein [Streptosporangiaceae bacterium]|nr:methyltransferase domain-containing protein [Streptosporangiaceae bacterium]
MREPVAEPDVRRFYEKVYSEAGRLTRSPQGQAEFLRTQELLRRLLPAPPAIVLDVGGGPGTHARWLATDGYAIHLIDLVPGHARTARDTTRDMANGDVLLSASVGDARRLPARSGVADAVLMLGPLYHLTERADRVRALREAGRAARPGGVVVAAAISRNAALMDMTQQGRVTAATLPGLLTAYATGVHDPRAGFTTAYFHRPDELAAEFAAASLGEPQVFGIEGPLWPLLDASGAQPPDPLFVNAMTCARTFETDPAIIGASSHLLAAARAPRAGR